MNNSVNPNGTKNSHKEDLSEEVREKVNNIDELTDKQLKDMLESIFEGKNTTSVTLDVEDETVAEFHESETEKRIKIYEIRKDESGEIRKGKFLGEFFYDEESEQYIEENSGDSLGEFLSEENKVKIMVNALEVERGKNMPKEDLKNILDQEERSEMEETQEEYFSGDIEAKEDIETSEGRIQKEFEEFEGDPGVKLGEGTVLFLKWKNESPLKYNFGKDEEGKEDTKNVGGSFWVRIEVTQYKSDKGMFRIKINGVDQKFSDDGIESSDIPFVGKKEGEEGKKSGLKFLQEACNNKDIIKLQEVNSLSGFVDYIKKEKNLEGLDQIEKGKNSWKGVEVQNNKLVKKDRKKDLNQEHSEEIEYIGKKLGDKYVMLEVNFGNENVSIKSEDGNYRQQMDYDSFFMFVTEKGLNPYTKTEYDELRESEKTEQQDIQKKSFQIRWTNIPTFYKYLKSIPETYKKHWQDRYDLHAAQLYAGIIDNKFLQKFGVTSEMANEAIGKLDDKIWSYIQNYKNSLSQVDQESKEEGIHAKRSAEIIENQIFNKSNIHKNNYLRAIGYLMFAVEKGGPYFRSLSKYSNQGKWVEAILGKEHQQKFKRRIQNMLNDLERRPDDDDLKDKIMKEEIFYIQEVTKDNRPKFGSKAPTAIEDLAYNHFNKSKADQTYNNEKGRKNFEEIYDGYINAFISQGREIEGFGLLKALSEKAETSDQYYKWYASMLVPLLTGVGYQRWSDPLRGEFKKICRTFGLPLGHYIDDIQGPEKIVRLLDYISKSKNKKPFSEKIGRSDLKNKNGFFNSGLYEFMDNKKATNYFKEIAEWLSNNGEEVTKSLNMLDHTLLEGKKQLKNSKDSEGERTYEVLQDYLDNKLFEEGDALSDLEIGDEIFVENGLFTLGKEFFEGYMLRVRSNGYFVYENGKKGWQVLNKKMRKLKDRKDYDDFEFILKKFNLWFKNIYGDYIEDFIAALYQGDREDLEYFTERYITSSNNYPTYVRNTLKYFAEFFWNNIKGMGDKDLRNVIKNVWGEEYIKADILNYNKKEELKNKRKKDRFFEVSKFEKRESSENPKAA